MPLTLGVDHFLSAGGDSLNQFRERRYNPRTIKVNVNEQLNLSMILINQALFK